MFSPFSIELKTILVAAESDSYSIMHLIKSFVDKNKGEDAIIVGNSIAFKSGFFGWTWDPFSQIDKGVFILNKNELTFKFYFIRVYIFFGLFLSFVAYQSQNIFIPILLFITLMTLNWVTARARCKKLLLRLSTELNNYTNTVDTQEIPTVW